MKKKIFVYSYGLELGGIESSLIGLLNAIDYNKYEVDLFLVKHIGELFNQIPESVNLLPEEALCESIGVPMKNLVPRKFFYPLYSRIKARIMTKLKRLKKNGVGIDYEGNIYHKDILNRLPKRNKVYDIALSFYFPHYYVINKVTAKVKIGWIHTDYSKLYLEYKSTIGMFRNLDYIAAISDDTKNVFLKKFPEVENKTIVVENILPAEYIRKQSFVENVEFDRNFINILSVGRFCEAKNFDTVPVYVRRLREKGLNIRWYLIGFGSDEERIRENIIKNDVKEEVIVLGKKSNPYPYMRACDIYIQPSRYEGKSVTVREAQILHKPVIITDFPTAKTQVVDGYDGIIVPMDNTGCADGIIKVIKDKELQKKLIKNMKNTDYSNENEVQKIYDLLGDYL